MKKSIFFFVVSLLLAISSDLTAQVFVVEHAGVSSTFTSIKTAVAALQNDDKLYLPTGLISLSECVWTGYAGNENQGNTLAITKRVSIYGAGYNQGINSTIISDGHFFIGTGAEGTTVSGIRFDGRLTIDNVSNVMMSRCKTNYYFNVQGTCANNYITECDMAMLSVSSTGGVIMTKNIINSNNGTTYQNSTISNNIFFFFNNNFVNCSLMNNVFICSRNDVNTNLMVGSGSTRNNSFSYNLWVGANPYTTADYNITFSNEKVNQLFSETFVDFGAGNYHLKSVCQGVNAGNDGKDVGIYGTAIPFKESRLPAIPFFAIKSISSETDATGKLPVSITVQAQDR